ncbi:uncharacterized protein LOC110891145 [Helianthus annuus]|uniref:uncharacterized protein LOC110891145 n=1 Tax=Helianthus annuus TaxID=4232 RepID=UPI000B8F7CA8|nr:uncharacterized protein LOC110891145 [Helianthus annuus]
MGFHPIWCDWIKCILHSSRATVLVNGSPTFDFSCEKGLRQGDPLSPFLFLIVMESLSWLLEKAKDIDVLKGEWSRESIQSIAKILRIFYLCSGLRINLHKSNIFGVGTEESEVDNMMEFLGCKRGGIPFVYLGIQVGAKMTRISNWDPVIEVIRARLVS